MRKLALILPILFVLFRPFSVSAESIEITSRKTLNTLCRCIQDYGYVCPRVALAYNKGYVPEGVEIKIFCGPQSGGCNMNLIYRLILDANTGRAKSLTPWR